MPPLISHTEEGHEALKLVCGRNKRLLIFLVFNFQFKFEIELITSNASVQANYD